MSEVRNVQKKSLGTILCFSKEANKSQDIAYRMFSRLPLGLGPYGTGTERTPWPILESLHLTTEVQEEKVRG
jgi:hypothetical protein